MFAAAVTTLLFTKNTRPSHKNYLRSRNSLPTNNQHIQWKIKRKLVDKGDWDEDDDDFVNSVPFHEQDDDATNNMSNQAQTPSIEENESEAYLERYKDSLNENSVKIEEELKKKEKGIVFSDSAGDKEAEEDQVVPLPPPPPLPSSTENSKVEEQIMKEQQSTENEKESGHKKTTQSHSSNNKHNSKHKNKQQSTQDESQEDESKTADTIFDDLLRGFTFAASFCALTICIYKFCGYVCVKCGIVPDERVLKARWRRSRLKKKRAYGESNFVPPLDTRKWAEWSAKRGRNGGVWDSGLDDIENNGTEAGAIVFDNSGIEMAEWEGGAGNDSGSEMELEFGEGDELEDKSHDERLFDGDDDGEGVVKEANKFFEKQNTQKVSKQKTTNNKKKNDSKKPSSQLKSKVDEKVDEVDAPSLFNASFDALDPPSGENGLSSKPNSSGDGDGADSASSAAKDFLLEVSNSDHHPDLDTNNNKDQDDDQEHYEVNDSFHSADDRGYDEDADLLGLRSESPPPLDLEEIEKNLVENMNKAKFY